MAWPPKVVGASRCSQYRAYGGRHHLAIVLQVASCSEAVPFQGRPLPTVTAPGAVTMEHMWSVVPTHTPTSTVEFTGDELRTMLEASLERTYLPDAYCQRGGFVERCPGLNRYFNRRRWL